jgi:hypothetical protein
VARLAEEQKRVAAQEERLAVMAAEAKQGRAAGRVTGAINVMAGARGHPAVTEVVQRSVRTARQLLCANATRGSVGESMEALLDVLNDTPQKLATGEQHPDEAETHEDHTHDPLHSPVIGWTTGSHSNGDAAAPHTSRLLSHGGKPPPTRPRSHGGERDAVPAASKQLDWDSRPLSAQNSKQSVSRRGGGGARKASPYE